MNGGVLFDIEEEASVFRGEGSADEEAGGVTLGLALDEGEAGEGDPEEEGVEDEGDEEAMNDQVGFAEGGAQFAGIEEADLWPVEETRRRGGGGRGGVHTAGGAVLLGVFDAAGFAEEGDADLAGVLDFVLDFAADGAGEGEALVIGEGAGFD